MAETPVYQDAIGQFLAVGDKVVIVAPNSAYTSGLTMSRYTSGLTMSRYTVAFMNKQGVVLAGSSHNFTFTGKQIAEGCIKYGRE